MTDIVLSPDGRSVTVTVPFRIRKRGGRKLVLAPEGHALLPEPRRRPDTTMARALARAFRWRRMLEGGQVTTVEEIAAAEKINASYVSRVLRLTLLVPDIVEAILDGRQPPEMQLADLLEPFPVAWPEQRTRLLEAAGPSGGQAGSLNRA